VLLLVSLLERQAVVLADSGARAAAPPEAWEQVVAGLTAGLAAGRYTEAVIEAVQAVAGLAARLPARGDDTNELTDEVRVRHD
jgi:putative membrane protein